MSLPVPNLDDRRFAGFIDQARAQIPRYAPRWTDHNVHDPGITFLELFAWLAELQIYYLNQVPVTHEVKFLRLLGIVPRPASAATAHATFALPDRHIGLTVPQGTQVAAQKPASREPIVFETAMPLQLLPIDLAQVIVSERRGIRDQTQANEEQGAFYSAFCEEPERDSALYLGLGLSSTPPFEPFEGSTPPAPQLTLMVALHEDDLPPRGAHGDEQIDRLNLAPVPSAVDEAPLKFFPSAAVVWEYWNGLHWVDQWPDGTPLLHTDETWAFTWSANITFNWPPDIVNRPIPPLGKPLYWLRCRLVLADYEIPPRVESLRLHTIQATQGMTITGEVLPGSSQDLPKQIFTLAHPPILTGTQRIEVTGRLWQEVADFDASGPDDEHYVLDRLTGEVQFGDGVNGRIPPAGEGNIRATIYRSGGGTLGNVGANTIQMLLDDRLNQLGVDVNNAQAAAGGAEEETLADARLRALRDLRTPYQAVTSADYEFLAEHTPELRVLRSKALPLLEPPSFTARKGLVTVAVVPFSFSPKPMPSEGFRRTVCEHLNRHRLITTDVRVIPPDYVRVSVEATVLLKPGASAAAVLKSTDAALRTFLDPLRGGVGGAGWEFGRSVYQSEIYQVIEGVDGVDCVMSVALAAQGNFQFEGNNIKLTRPHGLVYSGEHRLTLIDPAQACEIKGPCHEPKQQQ